MTIADKIILRLGKDKNFKKQDLALKLGLSRVTLNRKIEENDWTQADLYILEQIGIK